MKNQILLLTIVLLFSPAYAGKGPGEVDIPPVSPLNPEQLTRLRELVETDDEAPALAEEARRHAQPLRQSEPQPIAVIPFARGEKQHKEWVNTKVEFDRKRAKAGLEKYRTGRLFDPRQALNLLERAAYFDPSLMNLVRDLSEGEAQRFPTWQTLLNAAARPRIP